METSIITKDDLSLGNDIVLNEKQLQFLFKKTPAKFVKQRPAKGGGKWDYVSGGYIRKVLNLMFGFDWDFEIIENTIAYDEVVVKGRLTVRTNNKIIIKMQYGNKSIIYRKETKDPLSIGNDMKAAATDALKKCAAQLGIAADVYDPQEFKEITIKGVPTVEKKYE